MYTSFDVGTERTGKTSPACHYFRGIRPEPMRYFFSDAFSVIFCSPFNCAKRNITRRQPNITAKQYNPSNGNRIEKSTSKRGFFCVTASNRIWYAKKPVFEAMLCIKWIAFFFLISTNAFMILLPRQLKTEQQIQDLPCFASQCVQVKC